MSMLRFVGDKAVGNVTRDDLRIIASFSIVPPIAT
jgi:hypothetical protein